MAPTKSVDSAPGIAPTPALTKMSSTGLSSFGAALGLLEQSSSTGTLPKELADFLRNSVSTLANLHDPFNPANPTSTPPKPTTTTPAALSVEEHKIADRVVATFELDKTRAADVVRAVNKDKAASVTEQDWDVITAYVFEERMAVIGIVATLLRTSE